MTHSVCPHEIATLLDRFPAAKCLSLDCFDTLVWRDTHAPVDVFAALPGVSRRQRVGAETAARKAMGLAGKGSEVSIEQIHARLWPNGPAQRRQASVMAELKAEASHCYAFAPVVELVRAAKARGLEVIIVSDTYLDKQQLRDLIAAAAGDDVACLIDRVFCSSAFGVPKAAGLYGKVLGKLPFKPDEIVHLGDNFIADVEGVVPLGVNAVHLVQFEPETRQRLRMEAGVDTMLHRPQAREGRAMQPHRAALALAEPQLNDPAEKLGAAMLGPLFHAFEHWLQEEAEDLATEHGGQVHWLFLMRDGHLPMAVHALSGEGGHAVEISRFTATAAHFTSDAVIAGFVEEEIGLRPTTLARQILMDGARADKLLGSLSMEEGSKVLLKETRSGPFRKALVRQSRAFADRLEAHVRQACNPARGDVLMLVDLGYNGTVQNRIDAVLAQRLGCHVAGRYLLLREQDLPGLDKRGLIDARHYPAEMLEAMCGNVALLEQLCTCAQGSVIDYAADGTPICGENDIKQYQSEVRGRVQAGCLAYQRAAARAVIRPDADDMGDRWRQAAVSVLARVMFLPLPSELAVVEAFEHDVNMGTGQTVALFDRDIARRGLRQRGLFYMNGSERMYLPAELDREGLETRLSLMAHRLFDPPFAFADFGGEAIDLPVTFIDAASGSVIERTVSATPTHDGFYTAAIPVGEGRFHAAVGMGALCEWFELEGAVFMPVHQFLSATPEVLRREFAAEPLPEGIEPQGKRLFHCPAQGAHLLVPPPADAAEPLLLALTFRPLDRRQAASATTEEQFTPAERARA